MVIAQDLRLELRWDSHDQVLFVGFGGPGAAGSFGAHGLNSDGHNTGSAIAARVRAADCPAAIVSRPPPPDPWPAQHPIDAGMKKTVMRHFILPRPVAARSRRVLNP